MPSLPNYTARILTSIEDVEAAQWDHLLPDSHPFLRWDFLRACEGSGSASANTGWTPVHILLENDAKDIIGAAPLYAKTHSRGEYVFDHGWANALERAGGAYYPKLQCSVPFTPATGPRLLAKTPEAKSALLAAMEQLCGSQGFSGAHITFMQAGDRTAARNAGWLERTDRQFHFINQNYKDFDDFLSSLSSRKRKNIRKERRAAQKSLTIKRLSGADLKPEHWDVFFKCYLDTSLRKWGQPYFAREFFAHIHETLADNILLVMAWQDGDPIAAALNFIGSQALYGRNWGTLARVPFLHFELCYYQAIEASIERGLKRVEAGAQGEHKLARGYEPIETCSAHYIHHSGLRAAVDDYLQQERLAVSREIGYLGTHTPYKKET